MNKNTIFFFQNLKNKAHSFGNLKRFKVFKVKNELEKEYLGYGDGLLLTELKLKPQQDEIFLMTDKNKSNEKPNNGNNKLNYCKPRQFFPSKEKTEANTCTSSKKTVDDVQFQNTACPPQKTTNDCKPKIPDNCKPQNSILDPKPKPDPCAPKTNPCSPKPKPDPCATKSKPDPCATKSKPDPCATKSKADPCATESKPDPCATKSKPDPCATKYRTDSCAPEPKCDPCPPKTKSDPFSLWQEGDSCKKQDLKAKPTKLKPHPAYATKEKKDVYGKKSKELFTFRGSSYFKKSDDSSFKKSDDSSFKKSGDSFFKKSGDSSFKKSGGSSFKKSGDSSFKKSGDSSFKKGGDKKCKCPKKGGKMSLPISFASFLLKFAFLIVFLHGTDELGVWGSIDDTNKLAEDITKIASGQRKPPDLLIQIKDIVTRSADETIIFANNIFDCTMRYLKSKENGKGKGKGNGKGNGNEVEEKEGDE